MQAVVVSLRMFPPSSVLRIIKIMGAEPTETPSRFADTAAYPDCEVVINLYKC